MSGSATARKEVSEFRSCSRCVAPTCWYKYQVCYYTAVHSSTRRFSPATLAHKEGSYAVNSCVCRPWSEAPCIYVLLLICTLLATYLVCWFVLCCAVLCCACGTAVETRREHIRTYNEIKIKKKREKMREKVITKKGTSRKESKKIQEGRPKNNFIVGNYRLKRTERWDKTPRVSFEVGEI